jgi:hypothetical protein
MVSLTKILDSRAAINGTLLNAQVVRCLNCEQTYRLEYDEGGPPSERLAKKGGHRYTQESQARQSQDVKTEIALVIFTRSVSLEPIWLC